MKALRHLLPIFLLPGALSAQEEGVLAKALAREIRALESHPMLGKGRAVVGALFYDLGARQILFAHRPDEAQAPASNMKILTTAGALAILGREWSFETRAWAQGTVAEGCLQGDLVVAGGGDPSWCDLVPGREPGQVLDSLAAALRGQGVKLVAGRLVVDGSWFDAERVHPDWPPGQLHAAYCAPIGGLSVALGCVTVEVAAPKGAGSPVQVRLEPPGSGLALKVRAQVAAKPQGARLLVAREGEGTVVVAGSAVAGTTQRFALAVADPVLFAGRVLAEGLAARGIPVAGGVAVAPGPVPVPEGSKPLWRYATPLALVLPVVNKESQNLMAEHLLKTMGRVRRGHGSFAGGAQALAAWLAELEIPAAGLVLRDGSGLSAENRLSPRALVGVLTQVWRSGDREPFLTSLPLGGEEGTLSGRMKEEALRGRVRAKTGWIRGASALSGFLAAGGKEVAFSILVGYPRNLGGFNRHCKEAQDRMLEALASWALGERP